LKIVLCIVNNNMRNGEKFQLLKNNIFGIKTKPLKLLILSTFELEMSTKKKLCVRVYEIFRFL